MKGLLTLIKLNLGGALIFIAILIVIMLILVLFKFKADSKVLALINIAEATLDTNTGEEKKNYVLSSIYTTYPWLRVLLSKDKISRYVDKLVYLANEVYNLSKKKKSGEKETDDVITAEEIDAVKKFAYKVLLTDNKNESVPQVMTDKTGGDA